MKPRMQIRRFDVFAEYKRLEALRDGTDEAHAKGYGLWVAKVVASGGRRSTSHAHHEQDSGDENKGKEEGEQQKREPEWHDLGGEAQTDTMFDHEIIGRMGEDFYNEVFAPAIAQAFAEDRRYESIRDIIRKDWKP